MIYLDLFLGFLWVGCFSFGGAYAAIPLIRDVVLAYGWLTDEELAYMIAVGESTPGPIMVNLATYVGVSQAGFLGGVLATFAVVLPAFVIILLVVRVLKSALKNRHVNAVLDGLKPCIAGIILATGAYMTFRQVLPAGETPDPKALLLTLVLGGVLLSGKRVPPIGLILLSAVCALILY